jgi:hypothetical protein
MITKNKQLKDDNKFSSSALSQGTESRLWNGQAPVLLPDSGKGLKPANLCCHNSPLLEVKLLGKLCLSSF